MSVNMHSQTSHWNLVVFFFSNNHKIKRNKRELHFSLYLSQLTIFTHLTSYNLLLAKMKADVTEENEVTSRKWHLANPTQHKYLSLTSQIFRCSVISVYEYRRSTMVLFRWIEVFLFSLLILQCKGKDTY